jgi:outer membrane protein
LKKIIFASLLVWVAGSSFAQGTWTLQRCVDYALENNLTIKQNRLNVELSEVSVDDNKYGFLPSLNAAASQNFNYGRAINPINNTYVFQQITTRNMNVSSSVTLFNGFAKVNAYQASKLELQAEKTSLEKIKNDITLTVITYYLDVLYNEELLAVSKQQLEISKLQLDRAEKNAAVGSITQGDVLQIKAQLASDELNVTVSQNNLDLSKLNLIQLLDRDASERFEIERPANLDQMMSVSMGYNAQQVYNSALTNMPDVRLLEFRQKAARKNLAAAKGNLYPRISMNGGMFTDYSNLNPRSFSEQFSDNFGEYFGFQLTVPLFNGMSARNGVKRAKINLANAEINEQIGKNTLNKTITQSVADLNAADKKFESAKNGFQSLTEAFKYNQQKFDVGLINSFDYNTSKNNLFKAEADLLQAKYDLIFKSKVLDFYMGKSLSF